MGDTMEFYLLHHLQAPTAPGIWGAVDVELCLCLGVSCECGLLCSKGKHIPVFYPAPVSDGWAGSTAFPGQQRWTMGRSRFSPPAFHPFQETPLFSFPNSAGQVFKIRLMMQDLVKEPSNGLTGRTEEGWNIWQRKEDLIPEEITNYTLLFIEAKKVG